MPRCCALEVEEFLRRGVLAHGFARLHCNECGHDDVVAVSCEGRGFCPSYSKRGGSTPKPYPGAIMATDEPAPIERTFQDIPEQQPLDIESAATISDLGYRGGLTWGELLKSPRVLIVSEAGAGKTHECRAQRRAKWDAGEPAFYLELAVLAKDNVRDILGPEEVVRFDAWLASQSDVATFFLDSIDELNLTLGSFEIALKKLAKALGGQLGRAHIVVTSRPIPIDQKIMREILPIPAPPDTAATGEEFADLAMGNRRDMKEAPVVRDWRNVALLPLSDKQMRMMAVHEGVTDADSLLEDIRRRNAEEFARRPQDLIEICADWRSYKRIRTHRDQVASNVNVKLQPRKEESAPLSYNESVNGASRLALAAALTRKLTLRHSAEADRHGPQEEKPLDPATILPDWPAKKRATLLERPLFGFASYGRVRFHHRSVIEYLTAQRLNDLRSQGMPFRALRRMLFTETAQGITVVRPSMLSTAAWVALDDPKIFHELLEHEPSALFNYGDPESLTLHQRKKALRAYVEHYGDGSWRGMRVPHIQVSRFAGPDLGDEIVELWSEGIENEEVRGLLLELAGTGRNAECADIAHSVACDTALSMDERQGGLSVLIALGDARLGLLCNSLADEPVSWPDSLSRWAVVSLFPNHLSVEQLAKVLSRITESKGTVGDISYNLSRKIDRVNLDAPTLEELRERLTALVEEGQSWDEHKWPHLQTSRHFVVPALASSCVRLFEREVRTPEVLRSAIIAYRLTDRDYSCIESRKTLRDMLKSAPGKVREALFLADDAFLQSVNPEAEAANRYFRVAVHDGTIVLDPALDAAWLTARVSDRSIPADQRAVALEALIRMRGDATWEEHTATLKTHVFDLPKLVAVLDELTKPRKQSAEMAELERADAERQRQREHDDARARASWVAFWNEVGTNPDSVLSDERVDTTTLNLWRAMERGGENSRESGWNRRFIERYFGKDVANRIRLAFMNLWRRYRPTLRSERPDQEKNTYDVRWQLGLAAIHAEAEDPTWVSKLSPDEARLALRFVPVQPNGFPAWLDAIGIAHPSALTSVLGQELGAELTEPPSSNPSMLQNVRGASPALAASFLPVLQEWLAKGAWRNGTAEMQAEYHNRLSQVLSILIGHHEAAVRASVRALAESELSAHPDGPLARLWLPTLMRLDPPAGVDALERALAPIKPAKFGAGIDWFARLFGRHCGNEGVPLSNPLFTPALLLRLTRLAYQHVAREYDMARRDGMYTPNARDDAEHARNAVLSALLAAEGQAGWEAKLEMVNEPLFAHFRDRICAIALQRAAEEADAYALGEKEVAALEEFRELAPVTRDDMFALMKDRLDDLEDDFVRDESPRASWELIVDEAMMRQVIALRLRDTSNARYKVNQEAVTAEGKETDIRIVSVASDQEAVIELKVGEKPRSAAELRAAIKGQLVTKYMAPDCRRAGCLMVTSKGKKRWRHPDTGARLNLSGLVEMLNEECARLERQMGGSVRLIARGLDLSPRLPTEKSR